MLHEINSRIRKQWFNLRCSGISKTQPFKPKGGPLIVSMVCHRDMTMYMLAMKTFLTGLGEGRVAILNDGSLTPEDLESLRYHLNPVDVANLDDHRSKICPRGGCWERLLYIAKAVDRDYVIQMDSDTLTFGPMPEISSAVRENRSFALGTQHGKEFRPIAEAVSLAKTIDSEHVQAVAERAFERLSRYPGLKYGRCCAGFSGFAKGSFTRATLENFSKEMTDLVGKTWGNWGSEQVASNFIVANSKDAFVLPQDRYCNFNPSVEAKKKAFLHFLGDHRWDGNTYARLGRNLIRSLRT